jgi:hypothetical protein
MIQLPLTFPKKLQRFLIFFICNYILPLNEIILRIHASIWGWPSHSLGRWQIISQLVIKSPLACSRPGWGQKAAIVIKNVSVSASSILNVVVRLRFRGRKLESTGDMPGLPHGAGFLKDGASMVGWETSMIRMDVRVSALSIGLIT